MSNNSKKKRVSCKWFEVDSSVIRVPSEYRQSVIRVPSECYQSAVRVLSECRQSYFC